MSTETGRAVKIRIENERRGWNERFVNQEEKIEQLSVTNEELSQELSEVKQQNESGHFESELKVYRAVEVERKKWEARDEQILRLKTFATGSGDAIATPVLRANAEEFTPRRTCSSPERRQETESSLVITPAQLPPVPKFSGDSSKDDVENFTEWLEQFNLVAEVCQWNDRARLVNLVTRLKGSAYAFYRTCSPDQRSDYEKLTLELEKRFMPVRIPVVDTSMFHERKQQDKETVDEYAQELKRLFYKAYPRSQQCTREAEEMGKNVLSCQFLAGLKQSIKEKLLGTEGDLDLLLTKARFEEAKNDTRSGKPQKPPPVIGEVQTIRSYLVTTAPDLSVMRVGSGGILPETAGTKEEQHLKRQKGKMPLQNK